jgi:hypothetical protein
LNFYEMKTEAASLAKLGAYTDTVPPPNWPFLVNEALMEFSKISEYRRENNVLLTVANQIAYPLPFDEPEDSDYVRVTDLWYNSEGIPGDGGTTLVLINRDRLKRIDPLWKITGAGTPQFFYQIDCNTIGLYPPPSADDISLYFEAVREATQLVAETDTPDFPEFYHKALPRIAVWYQAEKYARGEERATAYSWYKEGIQMARELRKELAAGEDPAIQIRQQSEFRQRATLGGWQRTGWR